MVEHYLVFSVTFGIIGILSLPSYCNRFNTGNGEILPCVGSDQLPFRVKLLVVTRENCCQLISTRVMLNHVVVGVVVVI